MRPEKAKYRPKNPESRTVKPSPKKGRFADAPPYGLSWLNESKQSTGARVIAQKPKSGKKRQVQYLSKNDFQQVRRGIKSAEDMLDPTTTWLAALWKSMIPDPKSSQITRSPEMNRKLMIFRNHFKTIDFHNVGEVLMRFETIQKALLNLQRKSFRKVDRKFCADTNEPSETEACVLGRKPVIYLVKGNIFFPETVVQKDTSKVAEMGPWAGDPDMMGKILIHEVAHFSLGIQHRGGEFDFSANLPKGYPLKDEFEAINNAYTYNNFAYCISKSLV